MPIYRVTVGFTFAGTGSPGANVWHYRTENVLPLEDLEDGLTSLRTFYSAISAQYPGALIATIPEDVVRIDTDPPEAVNHSTTTMPSTGTSSDAPEMLALCINWKTTVRTRSGSGRTFIGPLHTGTIATDGTPDNTRAGIVRTAANALVARGKLADGNGAFGVYSRVQGIIRDFDSAELREDQFAVMRSRRD